MGLGYAQHAFCRERFAPRGSGQPQTGLGRVDLALRFIADGVKEATFSNPKAIEEHLAEHLILAASNDPSSPSVKKKHELERIAQASR